MLGDYIHSKLDASPKERPKRRPRRSSSLNKKKPVALSIIDENSNPLHQIDSGSPDGGFKYKFKEFVGHLDHAPDFLKYNPFLHRGYRINFDTPMKAFRSVFMLHNESVNIWTHLCGGIALLVICLFLCFSVSSFDSAAAKMFVKNEVGDLFKPVYHALPNYTQIEHDFSDKILHTREDIMKLGENTLAKFEYTLQTVSEEIEHIKENLNPEAIGRFLNKLKDELEASSELLKNSTAIMRLNTERKEKIKMMTKTLQNKLNELQVALINKIDSAAFNWVDIYKYIKPSYNNNESTSDNGYRRVPISRWPIIVFLLSAVFCLMCSAVYHTFHCLSDRATQILSRLDYAGISILITGSCFPPFVYGFYCQPYYSKLYLTLMGFNSVVVFIVSLGDKIHKFEYAIAKSIMYGGLVFSAVIPAGHLTYLNMNAEEGSDNLDFLPSLHYYLTMILCYLIGLIIYASKYPEKCCPGKFDMVGHSHQIWHVCVLLGIVFTYLGAFDNYYTRIKIPCIGCEL